MNTFLNQHRHHLLGLFLIVITLGVFSSVRYEFINFDDDLYVTENRHVQAGLTREGITWAFTTLHASNWHPLTWLSHMVDYELYGLNPMGHHLTNVLLHAVNILLLFLILRRMTGALWQSALVAALFALHPLHVESVAWVAERKDLLSTMFWFLTMGAYVRYTEQPTLPRYLLVMLALALGLMAKPMLVTLPLVLLLLDYWPLGRLPFGDLRAGWKRVWEKMPLFAMAAASSVMTYLAQQKGGSVGSLEVYPLWTRIENALVSYVSYIRKMLWPRDLAVFYPHPGDALPIWQVAGAGLVLVLVSILVVRWIRTWPYLAVGWLWYLGTLVPVIGLIQLGKQAMADRYTYVPLIGLFVMIAWGIPDLIAGWRYRRVLLTVSAGVLLSALMVGTWLQVRHWRNSITLFEHALHVTDNNYLAHNNLGNALQKQERLDEAKAHYAEALRIKPDYSLPHNNLGVLYKKQGRLDNAMVEFEISLALNPDYDGTHYNLGKVYKELGRLEEAIQEFQAELEINPVHDKAHNNLGNALKQQGKLEKAMFHYAEALRIKPDLAEAHYNLGDAYQQKGQIQEAIRNFEEALQIKPEYDAARQALESLSQ